MLFQLLLDVSEPTLAPSSAGRGLWIFLAVVGLLVAVGIGVLIYRVIRMLTRPELSGLTRERIQETWKQIEHTSGQGIMGAKLAVIEADKLVDAVMKAMMLPGETMGERLKSAEYKYPNIRRVWSAHKLRNQLVHDSAFEISVRQAKQALKEFHDALHTLNAI